VGARAGLERPVVRALARAGRRVARARARRARGGDLRGLGLGGSGPLPHVRRARPLDAAPAPALLVPRAQRAHVRGPRRPAGGVVLQPGLHERVRGRRRARRVPPALLPRRHGGRARGRDRGLPQPPPSPWRHRGELRRPVPRRRGALHQRARQLRGVGDRALLSLRPGRGRALPRRGPPPPLAPPGRHSRGRARHHVCRRRDRPARPAPAAALRGPAGGGELAPDPARPRPSDAILRPRPLGRDPSAATCRLRPPWRARGHPPTVHAEATRKLSRPAPTRMEDERATGRSLCVLGRPGSAATRRAQWHRFEDAPCP
jgi:hypothetical protein